jgi:transcriptional regulator with XRE-family HTH domain
MALGDRLKGLRLHQGMTLAALASDAGVSKSMLSRIERNDSSPTVSTLEKIAAALHVDLADLLRDPGDEAALSPLKGTLGPGGGNGSRDGATGSPLLPVSVLRSEQRKRLILPWGATYEMLTPDLQRRIEFIAITYPVNGGSGDLYTHEGEECGVVIEGRFRGIVGDQEFILEPGDSIAYASTTPHRWENPGDVEARAVWAITPPSFLIGRISE